MRGDRTGDYHWNSADGAMFFPIGIDDDDVALNDQMLSRASGGSPAALQTQQAVEMGAGALARPAAAVSSKEWSMVQAYLGVADHPLVLEAELHIPHPMPVPDDKQQSNSSAYGGSAIAPSILMLPGTSGYTAKQDGLKQETMQSAMAVDSSNRWPEMQRGQPERNKMAGVFNFSIDAESNPYYSRKLSTLYVDKNTNFTVRFKWDHALLGDNLMYVRAVVTYDNEAHKQNRVIICANHCDFIEGETAEEQRAECFNVLRSASASGSRGLHYCGARDTPDMWYSVLTPLEATHAYHMKCRGTCDTNTQRRIKQILFILENPEGTKFGLDLLRVQVCAAPSRDSSNAEKNSPSALGKRPAPGSGSAPAPGSGSAPAPGSGSAPAPGSGSALAPASGSAPAPAPATGDCKRPRKPATLTLPPIPVACPEILLQSLLHMLVVTQTWMRSNHLTPEELDAHKNSIEKLKETITELRPQMED